MAYKVVWLKRSIKKLEKIVYYLENNWSKRVALEFLDKINYKVFVISKNPQIGMRSEKKDKVRKILITKQIYLFYTVSNDKIKILTLFDNRQNPGKLRF
mgnify:CR=1 FL=1